MNVFGNHIFFCFCLVFCITSCQHDTKQFTLIPSEESGLHFSNDVTETQHNNIMTYEYSYNGGGVAAGDLNADGLADLYFSGNTTGNKLFLNKGDLRFEDVTVQSGTVGRNDWKTGVTMADVNGDGWLDIYVCYSGNAPEEGYEKPVIRDHPKRANELYINNGCEPGGVPTFTESASKFGLDAPGTFSTQAYFLDYDLDGDLDMFLLNHANMFYSAFLNTRRLRNLRHPYFGNKLYRNESQPDGSLIHFTDVSEQTRIHGSGLNFGLSAAISDLNGDRYPDIYVTNDYEEQDFCYINNRDGTFSEVSKKLFGHLSKYGMGSDITDINNDGLQDIIVLDMLPEDNRRQKLLKGPDEYDRYSLAVDSGYHHQYMRNTLQLNRGFGPDTLPRFSEVGQFAGISNTDWSWAPLAADYDNDGFKDLFVSNGFLRDFNNLDFIKYNANAYQEARSSRRSIDYLKLVQELPSTRIPNYVFRNVGGIRFENVTSDWGMEQPSVSNGAAYADFDNDGDLDLVTNNLHAEPFLYRNNQSTKGANRFVKVKLVGIGNNTAGLGAKVWITAADKRIYHEVWFGRGYQSSVEPMLTVGIGTANQANIKVEWPDGRSSVLENVVAGKLTTIRQAEAQKSESKSQVPNPVILTDVTEDAGLDFSHEENGFIDFKSQRLLHYQVSRLGGKFAKGDVDSDGNDDIYFGGAVGQSGALFLGRDDGTFRKASSQPWAADSISEDTHALFFDADSDGDQDLYVVSGGGEFISGAPPYQDRMYLNDGKGGFVKAEGAIPAETTSGSYVTAADYDKDGDLDLFVAGRLVPGSYGYIPRSMILRNDSGKGVVKFTDATSSHDETLASPGMVTSALWTDFNGDDWPDLILAGEWMPVMLFQNNGGKLERSIVEGLGKSNGWWTSIVPADIDRDGDTDYLLGNAGTNMQFKASVDEPLELVAGDFNQDGVIDPLITYYVQGQSYPFATRDELLDQMSGLRKKFVKYEDYANARIGDVVTTGQLEKSLRFSTYHLESSWMENGNGKDFTLHTLPEMAQISCINGFVFEDVTGDDVPEIIAAGNFYPFKPQLGRSDASYGLVMNYENGFTCPSEVLSNVWLDGDVRQIEVLRFTSGRRVVVSRNDSRSGVYSITPKDNSKVVVQAR